MASFERQLQRLLILEILSHTILNFLLWRQLKRNKFYGFLLGKGFREKCKYTELALNFIQKQ